MGISTEDVAGDIVDAMRDDRFWIFTHPFTPECASTRFKDIEAKRNPSDPYASMMPEGYDELKDIG